MSELRYNYLADTWVVIAPERERRPHDYPTHVYEEKSDPSKCPFEPGHEHMTPAEIFAIREPGSQPNGPGWKVRVIPNKYPAFKIETTPYRRAYGIYDVVGGFGAHEVVIDTPDHFKHLQNFSRQELKLILLTYRERMKSLYGDSRIRYVLVFKNHGKDAGKSLVHSHSQIIATPQIPKLVDTVISQSRRYFKQKRRCYLCDEIEFELSEAKRIVYENELFIVYCPFASELPFKLRIAPKHHSSDFSKISDRELELLADAVQISAKKLHKTLINPPFNIVIHTRPPQRPTPWQPDYFDGMDEFFHWYMDFLPRIAIQAGFELGSGYYINPTSPETAAKYLREVVL